MTATEKVKIEFMMIKSVDRIATKNGLKYRDFVIMVLNLAECLIRFCVREGIPGCKRNSRKVKNIVKQTFIDFANRSKDEKGWWLKDDKEDEHNEGEKE